MKKAVIAVTIGLVIVALIITFGQVFTVRYIGVEFDNSVSVTDKQEIISYANISSNTNIFILDEKAIKQSIEGKFEDNSIKVSDIERKFPNKVIIRVAERTAIYKIAAHTGDISGFVSADRNFQRNTIYSENELAGIPLVEVSGFEIRDTFNVRECEILKYIADALMSEKYKIAEEGIPYLIKEININGDIVKIQLKTDDYSFEFTATGESGDELKRSVYTNVLTNYSQYLQIPIANR